MNDNTTIAHPIAKAASAVVAAGMAGYSWSEIAAMLAALYTVILIGEWMWKRIVKPFILRRHGITPVDKTDFGGLQ